MEITGYLFGAASVFIIYLIYAAATSDWKLCGMVLGYDNRPSTSKVQWFLWTVVVLFAYSAIYFSRVYHGRYDIITDIPGNILIAMGLSTTTMAAAKGITTSYATSGKVEKPRSQKVECKYLFSDDTGFPDLSKTQLMAWTLISVAVYLLLLSRQLSIASSITPSTDVSQLPMLPDIDGSLMVLMGLGQAAYIGKKLTTTSTARINGISPSSGPAGTIVTISGLSFSEKQEGSQITLNGAPYHGDQPEWSDLQIKYKIPDKRADGSSWLPEVPVIQIGLIINGVESANRMPFTLTAPKT